jgi:dTDP-glucose 4,6-dehydratase
MMKKLLVTGGAGFIGSEFVRQGVQRRYTVTVIDKLSYAGDLKRIREVEGKITFRAADITDRKSVQEIMKSEKPDTVVHWAAESHVDRSIADASPFLETNITGTQVLLDAAKDYGVTQFINISTDEVYGDLGKDGKFYESTPLNPSSPYSVSKASADMLGRAYQRTYGLPVITVRPSNNYGPWQYPEKLIPVIIMKAMNNERVPVYAKGENVREWLFVSDCADAVFQIMEKGEAGEIYNVGSGEEKKNIEVVKTVLALLEKPEDLIEFTKDRPGHDFRYSLNSDKIKGQLGWRCRVTFPEGLERTVRWYVKNMEWVKSKLA